MSWKKSLIVICKVLGMFVNILTTDDNYSLLNRDNLRKPIQMQLSQKHKIFSEFIYAFLKSRLSFEHFQKKEDFIAAVFPKLQTPKKRVKKISKKSFFRGPFDKHHVKGTTRC